MQGLSNGDSEQNLDHSRPNTDNWPSWWKSSGLLAKNFNFAPTLDMSTNSLTQKANETKPLGYQNSYHDSSSSQSTIPSHQEVLGMGGRLTGPGASTQFGDDNSYEKQVDIHTKPVLSLETPQIDYSQSIPCIRRFSTDSYCREIMASYGSHAIIHPQLVGMGPSDRVPLPLEPAEDGPIYVNPKQYNGILRRRQLRAKLEAENKLIRERKPYLHESRHLHAVKRARGAGGRFLTKKELQEHSKPTDSLNVSGSSALQLGGSERRHQRPEIPSSGNRIEFMSMSEGRHSFATGLRPHSGGNMRDWGGSMILSGPCHRVPFMR